MAVQIHSSNFHRYLGLDAVKEPSSPSLYNLTQKFAKETRRRLKIEIKAKQAKRKEKEQLHLKNSKLINNGYSSDESDWNQWQDSTTRSRLSTAVQTTFYSASDKRRAYTSREHSRHIYSSNSPIYASNMDISQSARAYNVKNINRGTSTSGKKLKPIDNNMSKTEDPIGLKVLNMTPKLPIIEHDDTEIESDICVYQDNGWAQSSRSASRASIRVYDAITYRSSREKTYKTMLNSNVSASSKTLSSFAPERKCISASVRAISFRMEPLPDMVHLGNELLTKKSVGLSRPHTTIPRQRAKQASIPINKPIVSSKIPQASRPPSGFKKNGGRIILGPLAAEIIGTDVPMSFHIASIQEFIVAEELCKDLKLSPNSIVDQLECGNTENEKSQDLISTSLTSISQLLLEVSNNPPSKQTSQISLSPDKSFNPIFKSNSNIGRQKYQMNVLEWEEVKKREDRIAKEIETLDSMLNIKLAILGLLKH